MAFGVGVAGSTGSQKRVAVDASIIGGWSLRRGFFPDEQGSLVVKERRRVSARL